MPRMKKMGQATMVAPVSPAPSDPTRTTQNMSYPPDQSIYSNPITSNQQTGVQTQQRAPNTLQTGSLPNMQMSPTTSSPNSLPTSQVPQTPVLPQVNPSQHA